MATTTSLPAAAWSLKTPCASGSEWTAATAVLEFVAQADGPAREKYLEVLNLLLRTTPELPRALKLDVIHLIDFLDERQEAAQLAADPARRAGLERAAAHFAPKAQSSIAPIPTPAQETTLPCT